MCRRDFSRNTSDAAVSVPRQRYPERARLPAIRRLLEEFAGFPACLGRALERPAARSWIRHWSFDIEGRPRVTAAAGRADSFAVTPGYFEALRIPLRADGCRFPPMPPMPRQ